jgi:phage tail protein X
VLAKNPNGQKLIKQYYGSSSAAVKILESNPGLKDSAREYLEAILPVIEKMTKEKAGK